MILTKKMTEKIDFMARRRARTLVLQGLYQYHLTQNSVDAIRLDLLDSPNHPRCDEVYFEALWQGVTREREMLLPILAPYLDRDIGALSPIEQSVLLLAAWELNHRVEIPYRIIINEAIDLTKIYGGTDGHKFVNGVLDKLAAEIRAQEIERASVKK